MKLRQIVRLIVHKPDVNEGCGIGVRDAIAQHKKSVKNLERAINELVQRNDELMEFKRTHQQAGKG